MPLRLWLWPNLLSLDAPLVAVLWQILFVRCFGLPGDAIPAVLLVAAVWLIYAADRAFDVWRGEGDQPRHEFYRRHWRAVLPVWSAVLVSTAVVAWRFLPQTMFLRGAWLLGAVAVYFVAVHLAPARIRQRWPKEAVVAVLFALGASLPAWVRVQSLTDVLTVLLFSCLCWINCIAIEQWEHGGGVPVGAAAAGVGVAALALLAQHRPVLAGAEVASALAFVWLDRARLRLSSDALRVLADAALLSPVFFLPLAGIRF